MRSSSNHKHLLWRWESFRQRPCDKWPMCGDHLLLFFLQEHLLFWLIRWELSPFPSSVAFLPLYGRGNATSGLAPYQVNSNFTPEQLILRDRFPCRHWKANVCLKTEEINCLFFSLLNPWKSSCVAMEEVDQSQSAPHWVPFSSRKGPAPGRRSPPGSSSHQAFRSRARSLGIAGLCLL